MRLILLLFLFFLINKSILTICFLVFGYFLKHIQCFVPFNPKVKIATLRLFIRTVIE